MPFTDSINMVDVIIADKNLLSATPDKVLSGNVFIGNTKLLETGSMPNNPERNDITLTNNDTLVIPYGFNPKEYKISVNKIEDSTIATANDHQILEGKTAWVNGKKVTGTMPNVGVEKAELAAGESHKISEGYHNGFGEVVAKSLFEQTRASISPEDILIDKYAWGDGEIVRGVMPNNGSVSRTLSAGESFTIPEGYHNGKGIINANILENQTFGTAYAEVIVEGYYAWANGKKVEGKMPNNNPEEIILPINGTYVIPNGYHTGTGKIIQNIQSKPGMTIAPSKEDQVINTKGYAMEGDIIVTGIDALSYKRPANAIHDSTGREISNYELVVKGNSSSISVSVDNWHDNATMNVYRFKSDNMIDAKGISIPLDTLIMLDWVDNSPRVYKVGSITITTSIEINTHAHKIDITGITSGTVSITELFSSREFSNEKK